MFERLYEAFGIQILHNEVEQELATASDFAETLEARNVAERGDRLNQILSLGVPLGLGLALATIWFDFVGTSGVTLPNWFGYITATVLGMLVQIGTVTAVTLLAWIFVAWLYNGRKSWNKHEILLTLGLCGAIIIAGFFGGIDPTGNPSSEASVGNASTY